MTFKGCCQDAFFVSFGRKLQMLSCWPVMLVVAVGAMLSTVTVIREIVGGGLSGFDIQITICLWFTVLFDNFAEAMAEGRGKSQADALRKTRTRPPPGGW